MTREMKTPLKVLEVAQADLKVEFSVDVSLFAIDFALCETRIKSAMTDPKQWARCNKRWKGDVKNFALAFDAGVAHASNAL